MLNIVRSEKEALIRGEQVIDLKKLVEAPDPTFDEVMDVAWTYQAEGFQREMDDILSKNKHKKVYYIGWLFKPRREYHRLIQSTFFISEVEFPRMLSMTCFKVDNTNGTLETLWALPFDAPAFGGLDLAFDKLHPKIAESVQKSAHNYIFNNPLNDVRQVGV